MEVRKGTIAVMTGEKRGVVWWSRLRDRRTLHVCPTGIHGQSTEEAILLHCREQLSRRHLKNYTLLALALSTNFGLQRTTVTIESVPCMWVLGNEIFEKFLWGIVVAIVLVAGFGRHRVGVRLRSRVASRLKPCCAHQRPA